MNLEGWLHIVPLRIRSLFRRGAVEDELDVGGLALGTFISLGGIRAIASLLYGIEATDPFAFLGAAAVLLVAAALAAFSPARRATHVNPTVALRYE